MTEPSTPWHARPAQEVAGALEVDPARGLSVEEAARRLEEHGPNRLPEAPRPHPVVRFLRHFHNVLIYILIGAALFTALLGEWLDTAVIGLVVLVNAIVGFVQEGKAEEALEGIRSLLSPTARVRRGGKVVDLDAEDLVPGDVVKLESGDRVPADLRIVEALNARLEEALLTGESEPVDKDAEPVGEEALPADRRSMAFSGTLVSAGRLVGVVTATGSATEIGRIGEMVAGVQGVTTPLLRQIDRFGTKLSLLIVVASGALFLGAWQLRGLPPAEAFLAVVALAVAAIPEGLPAILTITLALGVQRMARRNAIIRKLPAVETLGSVSVICTDKTGTLTRNEMAAERLLLADATLRIEGTGYEPTGTLRQDAPNPDDPPVPVEDPHALVLRAARIALLCNEATFEDRGAEGRLLQGDPTEGALIVLAERVGLDPADEEEARPRAGIVPFESDRAWMATLHREPQGPPLLRVKGAPERVLALCREVAGDEGTTQLDDEAREAWEARMETVAGEGYRLLALAEGSFHGDKLPTGNDLAARMEEGPPRLTLVGVAALLDPPRPEAAEAVATCRGAGIRVVMITGDHATTARSIGARLGIGDGSGALTGAQVEEASDAELDEALARNDVVARAGPEHKLRIVGRLQAGGRVCAMTGDGVNDAPALKQADIGVAMGIKGTEAARSASEMVLADDNFASIGAAVEEGRTVYDNLLKTILFILPTNGAEALVILAGVALALGELPITPVQILWVNMITAVTLALALAFEPAEPGIMERPPRDPDEALLSRYLLRRVLYVSILVATGCLLLFQWEMGRGTDPATARTAVVNALVAAQLWYLFTCRFRWKASVGWDALVGNRAVLVASGLLILFQAAFTYLPPMQALFGTAPLPASSWGPILAVGLLLYGAVELEKAAGRSRGRGEDGGTRPPSGAPSPSGNAP
jgi:magnesium-transporting ATPase (P-type)